MLWGLAVRRQHRPKEVNELTDFVVRRLLKPRHARRRVQAPGPTVGPHAVDGVKVLGKFAISPRPLWYERHQL